MKVSLGNKSSTEVSRLRNIKCLVSLKGSAVFFRSCQKQNWWNLDSYYRKKHMRRGTTIIIDCFRACTCLHEEDLTHLTVKLSPVKDLETGAHTNTIELLWGALKRSLPTTNNHLFWGILHMQKIPKHREIYVIYAVDRLCL